MNKEVRIGTATVETRAEGERPVVRGYAAVFNSWSDNLGGFIERILPGAFDGRLKDDVYAYLNHDHNKAVGRNGANLRLFVDENGLGYELQPLDTTEGRDLLENLRGGLITKSSFGFTVDAEGDKWERNKKSGVLERSISKIGRLFDVSPLTTAPAYPDTSVALRKLEQVEDYEASKRLGIARANRLRALDVLGPELYIRAGQRLAQRVKASEEV